MRLRDFKIGDEFTTADGERRWRCTDIGTRVVVAIRIDSATLATAEWKAGVGLIDKKVETLTGEEAEARGLFRGPPYSVVESAFDEDELEACEPIAEGISR